MIIDPAHCFTCRRAGSIRDGRHDAIEERLIQTVRVTCPNANVSKQPKQHNGIAFTPHAPDIGFEVGGVIRYIDVTAAEPSAISNRVGGASSSITTAGGAAMRAEERKHGTYRDIEPQVIVIPFAVESSGRMGPSARALLNELCQNHPGELRAFTRDLSNICASYGGHFINFARKRMETGVGYGRNEYY